MDQTQPEARFEAAVDVASRQFTQGFLVGQITFGVLLLVVIRVFYLKNGAEARREAALRSRPQDRILCGAISATRATLPVGSGDAGPFSASDDATDPLRATLQALGDAVVLEHARYGAAAPAGAESCGWINVLLTQCVALHRSDPRVRLKLLSVLDEHLNGPKRPASIAPVMLTALELGSAYPRITGAAVVRRAAAGATAGSVGALAVRLDFELADTLAVGLETAVLLNWPRAYAAALPVSLRVTVERIAGSVLIEYRLPAALEPFSAQAGGPGPPPGERAALAVTLASDNFDLRLSVQSSLGNRTKIRDLPRLNSYVAGRLRDAFAAFVVWPAQGVFPLPDPLQWPVTSPVEGRPAAKDAATKTEASGGEPAAAGLWRRRAASSQTRGRDRDPVAPQLGVSPLGGVLSTSPASHTLGLVEPSEAHSPPLLPSFSASPLYAPHSRARSPSARAHR